MAADRFIYCSSPTYFLHIKPMRAILRIRNLVQVVLSGACRGFANRCGTKNSAREKCLSATPKFLNATSKAVRLVWLILLFFGFFISDKDF